MTQKGRSPQLWRSSISIRSCSPSYFINYFFSKCDVKNDKKRLNFRRALKIFVGIQGSHWTCDCRLMRSSAQNFSILEICRIICRMAVAWNSSSSPINVAQLGNQRRWTAVSVLQCGQTIPSTASSKAAWSVVIELTSSACQENKMTPA